MNECCHTYTMVELVGKFSCLPENLWVLRPFSSVNIYEPGKISLLSAHVLLPAGKYLDLGTSF